MKPKKNLYYIAIVPPEDVLNMIADIKINLAKTYKCYDSLRSLPVITLQIPFEQLPFREEIMIEKLRAFADQQYSFGIKLNGFSGVPDQSIGISLNPAEWVRKLQMKLRNYLIEDLYFSEKMTGNGKFRASIPVIGKGLNGHYRTIFNEIKSRKLNRSFTVSSMSLLKHNYTHWELLQQLNFRGVGYTMDMFSTKSTSKGSKLIV